MPNFPVYTNFQCYLGSEAVAVVVMLGPNDQSPDVGVG